MLWWQEAITKKRAEEFFAECLAFTHRTMKQKTPDVWRHKNETAPPFIHHLDTTIHAFKPRGVIIHSTQTTSVWDSIRSVARGTYGTHFLVSHKSVKFGDYLSELPSTIFLLMSLDKSIPHSGYMSTRSFSIDVRNAGRLRPWSNPVSDSPPPIFRNEENNRYFQSNAGDSNKTPEMFFSAQNQWRQQYKGLVHRLNTYCYEPVAQKVATTIAIIIKALDAYTEGLIDPELVLPSHAIFNQGYPVLPGLIYNRYQSMFDSPRVNKDMFTGDNLPHDISIDEWSDDTRKDPDHIFDISTPQKWRTNPDDGNGRFVFNGPDISVEPGSIKFLRSLGYSGVFPQTDIRMFIIANRLGQRYPRDAINQLFRVASQIAGIAG